MSEWAAAEEFQGNLPGLTAWVRAIEASVNRAEWERMSVSERENKAFKVIGGKVADMETMRSSPGAP